MELSFLDHRNTSFDSDNEPASYIAQKVNSGPVAAANPILLAEKAKPANKVFDLTHLIIICIVSECH